MNTAKLNSSGFWDAKINNPEKLYKSYIYLDKLNLVLRQIKKHQGTLLDLGIGYGLLEEYITRKVPNMNLFGIDISKAAIKNARSKFVGNFIVGDILNVNFDKSTFDYVLALDVLEHFDEKKCIKTLSIINSILKNDGILIISVPINENVEDSRVNHHLQKYNLVKIHKQLKNTSFEIYKKYYLTAYKNFYHIKKFINNILNISDPNLLILVCKKAIKK